MSVLYTVYTDDLVVYADGLVIFLVPIRFVLLKFMNTCFRLSIVSSSWQKAIIAPIPKNSTKDPYFPLNYNGISLLSCSYKMYSALKNNRLSTHCELNDLFVDEQNGVRPDRSCSDHICCLCSILNIGYPTICQHIVLLLTCEKPSTG